MEAVTAVVNKEKQDERTRQKVLAAVLDHGPVTASEVARMLELTAAAIRRHLDALEADGYVEVRRLTGTKAGRGRPARHYVLTERGHSEISNTYDDLAVEVLDFVSREVGDEGVRKFAAERTERLRRALTARLDQRHSGRTETVAARSRALAKALTAEGYAASASPVAVGTPLEAMQLCQGHCPIQNVAGKYPEFCEAELEMLSDMLGVDVRRLSTLASGGHVCTTHIPTSLTNRPLLD